ncbi:TIGR01212 family radical SAM protein [Sinanaerobacter chloroacetimidivorans]|uniref:TIGR01212 family radical SAM protein n=1 Tax=Sinanaerobacter chloroacetimidivorans TaxID=2818044 RepID=UPI001D0580A8|nr:TIGR01212 family radical SAM protein [Sinanaerobacter chloroacetimidivorans]
MNLLTNPFGDQYYNSIGSYLKKIFGCKIIKLSLDAGFTCPNRDGTKGTGGCIFCSAEGSGDFASNIPDQIALLSKKWPTGKYIAYFQSHTNTYAPVQVLREKFYQALEYPDVIGLAIATRPDCLSEEVLELLSELNEKTFLWVELGLQTIHENTAKLINRCYSLSVFDQAVSDLKKRDIKTVVHLILGLPGETQQDMHQSVNYVCEKDIFGIKLHLMNILKGTKLAEYYPDRIHIPKKEEYISLVVDVLERIPQRITIHRVTADAPRHLLLAPHWGYEKRSVLNGIYKEFKLRGSYQGIYCHSPNLPSL